MKFLPFYMASWLPFFVLYFLSDITFILLFYIIGYRRKVVLENLKNAFKDKGIDELKRIEKSYYKHLCDIIFESTKSLSIDREGIKGRFIVKNADMVHRYFSAGRSAIIYAGHFGNWEWMSFLPLSVSHQVTSFYQHFSNKYFDELVKIARERFGVVCVEASKGVKSVLSFEQRNILTLNLIIGDQCPRAESPKHWVSFLGQETAFLVGADKIAQKANHIILFPFFKKSRRGHYELEFQVITENPAEMESNEIIGAYAAFLERAITSSPEMWLWSHRRWKLTPEKQD
jgi:KDO2-lipid IV(A) lauroyltransferase